MRNLTAALRVIGLLLLIGTAAQAAPYALTNENPQPSQAAVINVGADSSPLVWVGGYTGDFTPVAPGPAFIDEKMFCFGPLTIGSATLYDPMPLSSLLGTVTANNVGALLANAAAGTTVELNSAIEAALLKLTFDPSSSDVTTGYLNFTGLTSNEITLADSYVVNVLDGTWTLPLGDSIIAWNPEGYGQPFDSLVDGPGVSIPEPASFLLLGSGLIYLVRVRWHRYV